MDSRTRAFLTDEIATTARLDELTGISEHTLQKRAERGKIDFVKQGRTYLFLVKDFEEQIERHRRTKLLRTYQHTQSAS